MENTLKYFTKRVIALEKRNAKLEKQNKALSNKVWVFENPETCNEIASEIMKGLDESAKTLFDEVDGVFNQYPNDFIPVKPELPKPERSECDNRPEILKRQNNNIECLINKPVFEFQTEHCNTLMCVNLCNFETAGQFISIFDTHLASNIEGTPEEIEELKNYMIGLIPEQFKQGAE